MPLVDFGIEHCFYCSSLIDQRGHVFEYSVEGGVLLRVAICDSDACIMKYLNGLKKAGQDISAELDAIASDRNKRIGL